jgi:ribosomal protein L32
MGYASCASCGTRSTIHSICAKCGLVERIAWKRAGQQKGQAEAIGSQHAGARVAGQMDREAGRMIAEQNERYLDKFRNPLLRKGEFPEELNFSSTPDRMQVRSLQESSGLIAAPDEPPGFARDYDLAARMHESAVTNYGQGLLAGYYLTDVELERIMREDLKADVPDELHVTDDKEPWAIKFAAELPARSKFSAGKVWMAVRADAFYRGQENRDAPYSRALGELIEISADYTIEKTTQGATMRRNGDVVISFPNARPGEQSIRRAATAGFLRLKFRNLFKEEFVGEGLKLKGDWEKAGRLKLAEVQADNAWVRLGWEMTGEGASPAVAAGGE